LKTKDIENMTEFVISEQREATWLRSGVKFSGDLKSYSQFFKELEVAQSKCLTAFFRYKICPEGTDSMVYREYKYMWKKQKDNPSVVAVAQDSNLNRVCVIDSRLEGIQKVLQLEKMRSDRMKQLEMNKKHAEEEKDPKIRKNKKRFFDYYNAMIEEALRRRISIHSMRFKICAERQLRKKFGSDDRWTVKRLEKRLGRRRARYLAQLFSEPKVFCSEIHVQPVETVLRGGSTLGAPSPVLKYTGNNVKSALYERMQKLGYPAPNYVIEQDGPSNSKRFCASCKYTVNGKMVEMHDTDWYTTKKYAESGIAKKVMDSLAEEEVLSKSDMRVANTTEPDVKDLTNYRGVVEVYCTKAGTTARFVTRSVLGGYEATLTVREDVFVSGCCRRKKEAERQACKKAYEKYSLGVEFFWKGALLEYCVANSLEPLFTYENYGPDHEKLWVTKLSCAGLEVESSPDSSKRKSDASACQKMLDLLLKKEKEKVDKEKLIPKGGEVNNLEKEKEVVQSVVSSIIAVIDERTKIEDLPPDKDISVSGDFDFLEDGISDCSYLTQEDSSRTDHEKENETDSDLGDELLI
jgi:dsRNA-specific ribonuclease